MSAVTKRVLLQLILVLIVIIVFVVLFFTGIFVGYVYFGKGNPSDAFQMETWQHILEFIS